jgi:hypothetical protein
MTPSPKEKSLHLQGIKEREAFRRGSSAKPKLSPMMIGKRNVYGVEAATLECH